MQTTVLARRGDPSPGTLFEHPCYRIPALAVTPSGLILCAWDVRADWRDLPGPFDIAYRTSSDNGRTWDEPRVLRAHEGEHGFGDASFIVDSTGAIHCWYVGSTGRSFFSADVGPDGEGLTLWLSTSNDDGDTWTHRDLSFLKPDDIAGMFASSGNGICLTDGEYAGRLIQPFVMRTGEGEHYAAMGFSDDDGATWELGERIGPDCDENKVVEIDGGVLLHARATPLRRDARSTDCGRSFSTPVPHPQLTDPACNGGLARWGTDLVSTLLDDTSQRRRLTLRTSADEGRVWSDGTLLVAGACAYSVALELPDGALAVVWEAGDYDEIVFGCIERDHLASLVPVGVTEGAAAPPEVGA